MVDVRGQFSRIWIVCGVLLFLGAVSDGMAKKGDGTGALGISPTTRWLEVEAGKRHATDFRVVNSTAHAGTFSLEIRCGVPTPTGVDYRPIRHTVEACRLAQDTRIEESKARDKKTHTVMVPAQSFKKVHITVGVDQKLKGTHYAGILVTRTTGSVALKHDDKPPDRSGSYKRVFGVGMQPATVVKLKASVKGTLTHGYKLTGIEAISHGGKRPVSFVARFKNTGNAELNLLPLLVVINQKRKVVARLKTRARVIVSPGSETEAQFGPASRIIPPGSYEAIMTASHRDVTFPPEKRTVVVSRKVRKKP